MFSFQLSKLTFIGCIVVVLLIFLNIIISAILSVLSYIMGGIIVLGLAFIVFIPEKKWINGAVKTQEFSLKIEDKIMKVITRMSKEKPGKVASTIDHLSDRLEQMK